LPVVSQCGEGYRQARIFAFSRSNSSAVMTPRVAQVGKLGQLIHRTLRARDLLAITTGLLLLKLR
jgi:hypothetical protein